MAFPSQTIGTISVFFLASLLLTNTAYSDRKECGGNQPICSNLTPFLTDTPTFSVQNRHPLTSQYDLVHILAQYRQGQRTTQGFFVVDTRTEKHVLTLATFQTEIGTDFHLLSATPEAIIIQKSDAYGYREEKIKYFLNLKNYTVSSPRSYPDVSVEKALVIGEQVFLTGHTKNRGDMLIRLIPSDNPIHLPIFELTQKVGGQPIGHIQELRFQDTTPIGVAQSHSYHFKQGRWSYQPPLTKILKGADGSTGFRVLDHPSPTDRGRLTFPQTPGGPTVILVWDQYLKKHVKPAPGYGMTRYQNNASSFVSMPQPTYQDFKKLRPKRALDGYTEDMTQLGNALGPWQVEDTQIWFGTTFYDGEGETGIGGFGRYDINTNIMEMTYLPETASWSISTLWMAEGIISMGLVRHPEGAAYSGGLVQYDIKTKHTQHIDIPEIIRVITQVDDTLVLGTTNGVTLIVNQVMHSSTFDIDENGNYQLAWQTSSLSTPTEE